MQEYNPRNAESKGTETESDLGTWVRGVVCRDCGKGFHKHHVESNSAAFVISPVKHF